MQISKLLGPETELLRGSPDVDIEGITADSRAVKPGYLFAALAGTRTDGARFVADAVRHGAVAVLARQDAAGSVPQDIAVLASAEPRRALALMAARLHPRQPGTIVAVTGTNGKTSIAEFARQIFVALGRRAASLGTIGIVKPDGAVYGSLTTPDPVTLHETLDGLAAEGVTHLAMEASSHGLDQFRLDGVCLTAAAFNNLGRDHLDYHPTMEAYLDAKLRLFRELMRPGQPVVVNADGPEADKAVAVAHSRGLRLLTTGHGGTGLRLAEVERVGFGQRIAIEAAGRRFTRDLRLIGDYQAGNALVAAGLALSCGEALDAVMDALSRLSGVSGRLEVVGDCRGGIAVVDYAHKPEALGAALDALRPFATGRLICVLGCGGDRDRGKRPIMGRIAAAMADVVIVTDDNPRSETPAAIRAEVLTGATGAREIGDRGLAIRTGVTMLGKGDVLLVAGKGHETGQIIGERTLPFSDQDEVAKAIRELGGAGG